MIKQNKLKVYMLQDLSFRVACAVMDRCDIYIGPEEFGHVAAALNKKAVLYFGGWISPKQLDIAFMKIFTTQIINHHVVNTLSFVLIVKRLETKFP